MERAMDDRRLIQRCVFEKDEKAWETFVHTYSPIIWAGIQKTFRAYQFPCQQDDVEDIFNSVFLALIEDDFHKLRQFRGDNSCSLSTWLTVVAGRMTIDYLRKDRRQLLIGPFQEGRDIYDSIPDNGHSPQQTLEKKQAKIALDHAVNALPRTDRLIYRLLIEREMSCEETAKLLDLTVETIYSRKNRITQKLKKICMSGKKPDYSASNRAEEEIRDL